MKKIILVFTFLISAIGFSQKIEKDLGDFTELKAFDQISVKLVKSNKNKAIISGAHADEVQLVNKNGVLKIRLKIEKSYQGEDTYVELHYKNLYVLDANEGAFIGGEKMKQSTIELRAQEGAQIRVSMDVRKATIKSVSGSQIRATGAAKTQEVTVNSGGIYKASKLISEQTTVSVSAGGNASINATDIVKATVKAGGNVKVYGDPNVVDKKTVLGGNITMMN